MSFNARFDLPNIEDDIAFEDCKKCRARLICYKLTYCINEEGN